MTITVDDKNALVLKNWKHTNRENETGHDYYEPTVDSVPVVLSNYGMHYAVRGFYANVATVRWLELERESVGIMISATLTPYELVPMDLGFSDDPELNQLLMQADLSQ